MRIILLTFLAFACSNPNNKNESCWELQDLESATSKKYGKSTFYIENDTLVLISVLEDEGNSGLTDIIREDMLLSAYNFNSDTLTCFNTIFTGIRSSNSLSWTRNHSLQDLYTLIFRDIYYPEFTSVSKIIISQLNGEELNQLDTLLANNFYKENLIDQYFKSPPESFTRLCFRATYNRLGGGRQQYENILGQLQLQFPSAKRPIEMILNRLEEIFYLLRVTTGKEEGKRTLRF